eukprot:7265523-Prorocentrum_lima.AAC.1
MGVIRALVIVGRDDEEGAGSCRRAFGRTLKQVPSKDTYEHFNSRQTLCGTPYYLPVVQK